MNLSRREFLASATSATAATLIPAVARGRTNSFTPKAERVIFINLIGGPSQLDTWDPKPDAPSDIRGPFQAIATKVPGMQFTELFPRMAGIADKLAVVRSVYHDAPPVHEAGLQIVNTGQYYRYEEPKPNVGAVAANHLNQSWRILGYPNVECGIQCDGGMSPVSVEQKYTVSRMSLETLSQHEITKLPSFLTVNQFSGVFNQPTWDCHAAGGALSCDLNDYRDKVAPAFDIAFTRLIQNLESAGLLGSTLVVATGEFGRTPKLNGNGGRDHWANCWSAIFAGGGVQGGRVIGSSDSWGAEPKDRPVHARDIPATVLAAVGIHGHGQPIAELF